MTETIEPIFQKSDNRNTLNRILACALEHFSIHGYLGASVREITTSAQVTKPTLYYYFDNKEELYRALATESFEKMLSVLSNPVHFTGNMVEDFCSFVNTYYGFCQTDLPTARFIQMLSFMPTKDVPEVGITEFKRKIDLLIKKMAEPDRRSSNSELILRGLFSLAVENHLRNTTLPLSSLRQAVESVHRS